MYLQDSESVTLGLNSEGGNHFPNGKLMEREKEIAGGSNTSKQSGSNKKAVGRLNVSKIVA
jgi:hypothetical protein